MKRLRLGIARTMQVLLLGYVLPAFAVAVVRAMWRARNAEILAFCRGGFGHTLTFPDCLRRTFAGRRTAAIYLSERGRYNPLVGELFSDCLVIAVTVRCSVTIFGYRFVAPFNWWLDRVYFPVLRWWCLRVWRRPGYMLPDEWHGLLPAPELALMGGAHLSVPGNQHPINAIPRYFILRERVPLPPVRLPSAIGRPISAALERMGPVRKTCCLYLRRNEGCQPENLNRNGGGVVDHLPAVEWLVARGYRVLLTGDLELAPALADRFAGMFVDYRAVGAGKELFSLYAATGCDIWIGVDGGGSLLPVVADRPMLGINWFPYYAIFPGMTAFYKYLVRPDGRLVLPNELFGRFAFDWRCDGHELLTNTPDQIRAAVSDFVLRLEAGDEPGCSPQLLGPTAEDAWFNIVPAWISTPWMEPFERVLHEFE